MISEYRKIFSKNKRVTADKNHGPILKNLQKAPFFHKALIKRNKIRKESLIYPSIHIMLIFINKL